MLWIAFVDFKSGEVGAYWSAREVATLPLSAGPLTFLHRTARVLIYEDDNGEKLKFITALALPLIHIVLLLYVKVSGEIHRLSILVSIIGMMAIVFLTNNPNKIIVYGTTIPGYLAIGILFVKQCFEKKQQNEENIHVRWVRGIVGTFYIIFCIEMAIFYILGTPLGWYF
jgi:hypothetical protein